MSNILKIAGAGVSAAAEETDPNFNQTVLLLHGDGTDGAQNNTFVDSSTNNFTVTRAGNTTQGTFSPFSAPDGRWSNYFDGTGDYLSVADNTALDVEASDFTVEFFVYLPATPSGVDVVFAKRATGTYQGVTVFFNGSLAPTFQWSVTGSTWEAITSSESCVLNQWNHVACTRSSNTWTIWVNGVSGGTATVSGTVANNSAIFTIGADTEGSSNLFIGHISNFRLVKGTAVYTAGFTPPTSPLTNITNTSLLTCQSNRFVDNSSNAFAITRNGDVKVTPFSPFAPTAAYDAGVNGGSGYFDGTGDWLSFNSAISIPSSTSFTVEGWFYWNAIPSTYSMIISDNNGNTSKYIAYNVGANTLDVQTGTIAGTVAYCSFTPVVGTWYHLAFVRNGTEITIYVNGVAQSMTTPTQANAFLDNGSVTYVGRWAGTTAYESNWYISNFRVVNGSAVYTNNFTPPTAPLTNITNTSLLLNFTNAGIFDNTGKNNLETVGNAQIDTATKKYGTGAMKFDGTGDYLVTSDYLDYNFGAGDFTIECFANFSASVNGTGYTIAARAIAAFNSTSAWTFWRTNTASSPPNADSLRFIFSTDGGATNIVLLDTPTFRPTTGVWYHLAVTRSGSTFRIFIDGVSQSLTTTQLGAATTSSAIFNSTRPLYIGATADNANNFNGFIDDLRITKGVARYTTAFTPPTKEFPNL